MEGTVPPLPEIFRLKQKYGFRLFIDEAHSFLALGSNGKGSLNYWQDRGHACRFASVDVMTCMFSKSAGCTGGMVLANGQFSEALLAGAASSQKKNLERLATPVLLRMLSLLSKPDVIRQRMHMLHERATVIRNAFVDMGFVVTSSSGSAIVCLSVGECLTPNCDGWSGPNRAQAQLEEH